MTTNITYKPLNVPSDLHVVPAKQSILNRDVNFASLPSSYTHNTPREDTLLEYVEDFRRQFIQVFPKRRPLLLCPLNECNIRKFICSTIRPTRLPFPDTYDYREAAEFVADYMTLLPLDRATTVPDLVASPSSMLAARCGDSLDLSLLLCCLLRGNGYDAYCVSGYAPQWITACDSTAVPWPGIAEQAEEERKKREEKERKAEEEKKKNKYVIISKPEHKSRYLAAREQEARDIEAAAIANEEARIRKLKEKAADPLHGDRIHYWCLILPGRRDVAEPLFIEATTGTVYPVKSAPYLAIDSVWNERNYWVNIQDNELKNTVFELADTAFWEHILLPDHKHHERDAYGDDASTKKKEETFDDRPILDNSLSWIQPLTITRENHDARYPNGTKLIQYFCCDVLKISPYFPGKNGLVKEVKIYWENKGLETEEQRLRGPVTIEKREFFANRKDLLKERRFFPDKSLTQSFYHPGKSSGLFSYTVEGEHRREFTFYSGARVDGLVKRVELRNEKIVEEYEGRDDFLTYRSITIDQGPRKPKHFLISFHHNGNELPIRKITEKYARNYKVEAENDVMKRTHFLVDNTIRLDYHYGHERITHSVHIIDKNDKLEQSETEKPQENSQGMLLRVDPKWKEKSRGDEQHMVAKLLNIEKELKVKIKEREQNMIDIIATLDHELNDANTMTLEKSIYDLAYESAQLQDVSTTLNDDESHKDKNKVDYLSPFLAQYPAGKPLTRRQAQQAKDECLATLKERLLERANIIQQHLEEEQAKLHQKQALFKRQAGSGALEASEEFNKFSNQCLFRIDILNARRARHEELALKKYVEMDERLNNDPRLAALHSTD